MNPTFGATVHTAESSLEKAFTVVTLGPIFNFDTSGEFFDLVKTNPYAPRLATVRNVMALPGGVAFKSKNAIVGALGVEGVLPAETRMKSAHKLTWRKSRPASKLSSTEVQAIYHLSTAVIKPN